MPIGMTAWVSSTRSGKVFNRTGPLPLALPRLQSWFSQAAAPRPDEAESCAEVEATHERASRTKKGLAFIKCCRTAEAFDLSAALAGKRLDFGLVGDTVNEAARIEALTKYYGVTLLVSRECFALITNPATHRLLDRVIVKGKNTPVELLEIENPRTPPNYAELVREWDVAFADYTAGKFAEARPVFAKLAERFNDGPSKLMVHRCEELISYPPTNWKGVWRMESK